MLVAGLRRRSKLESPFEGRKQLKLQQRILELCPFSHQCVYFLSYIPLSYPGQRHCTTEGRTPRPKDVRNGSSLRRIERSDAAVQRPRPSTTVPSKDSKPRLPYLAINSDGRGFQRHSEGRNGRAKKSFEGLSPMRKVPAKSNSSTHHNTLDLLKNWRLGVFNYERLQFEPNVEQQSTLEENRLADLDVFKDRKQFWEEQYLSRRRQHGPNGVRAVWNAFKKLPMDKSPNIYSTQQLWQGFVELALKEREVLRELVRYVKDFHEKRGVKPNGNPSLYCLLIGHALRHQAEDAYPLHGDLIFLQPNQGQLCDFVESLGDNEPGLSRFMEFCMELPSFKDMYGSMIPRLCEREMHNVALRWHYFLIERGNVPTTVEVSQPFLDYLSASGKKDEAAQMEKEITSEKVGASGYTLAFDACPGVRDLVRELDEKAGICGKAPIKISDEFCARLFATKFFSVFTIINGLQMLRVRTLGPLALREMLSERYTTRLVISKQ